MLGTHCLTANESKMCALTLENIDTSSSWNSVRQGIFEADPQILKTIQDVLHQIEASKDLARKQPTATKTVSIKAIDLSAFLNNGSTEAKEKIGNQIRESWESLGFMTVVNHGIPMELLERLKTSSLQYMNSTSVAEKLKLNDQWPETLKKLPPGQAMVSRGYSPLYQENASLFMGIRGLSPDKNEKLTFGALPPVDFCPDIFPDVEAEKYFQGISFPNIYPEEEAAPGLKDAMEDYMKHMQKISMALLEACAFALGLSEDFFLSRIAPGGYVAGSQRMIHYPLSDNNHSPRVSLGAHTDGGLLTILWRPMDITGEDSSGGLEIFHEGVWKRAALPSTDALTVNIGDLFQWWSTGKFLSTPHRVTRPVGSSSPERLSYAFFLIPNKDFEVSPLSEISYTSESDSIDKSGIDVPKMRYGAWFETRAKNLAGIDEDIESIPKGSLADASKWI